MEIGVLQVAVGAAAIMPTFVLVAGFKMGWPAAATSSVVIAAFVAGQLASLLTALTFGLPITAQNVGVIVLAGIGATASAMGIRGLDQKADERREEAKG